MTRQTRRGFLSLLSGAGISTAVSRQVSAATRSSDRGGATELRHSTLRDPTSDRPVGAVIEDDHRGPTRVRLDSDDQLVERIWNSQVDTTVSIRQLDSEGGVAELTEAGELRPEEIRMLYVERPNDIEFLTDAPVASEISREVETGMSAVERDVTGPRFERRFGPTGIDVTADLQTSIETSIQLEIPYSLYLHHRDSGRHGWGPLLPVPGDNRFDSRIHGPLVSAFERGFERAAEPDSTLTAYQRVDAIAEYVQWLPHALDWTSRRRLSHVRTPTETVVELTADCKDAALLLYHLYEEFGFSPVLVFLGGDIDHESGGSGGVSEFVSEMLSIASGTSDEDGRAGESRAREEVAGLIRPGPDGRSVAESKEKPTGDGVGSMEKPTGDGVEYPHHLAVALPIDELGVIPGGSSGRGTFQYDDRRYAYVESTRRERPGTIPVSRWEMTPILYRTRREFLAGLDALY